VVGVTLAHRAVPADLRHAITAESGINDGLAGPIVMLPVIILGSAGAHDTWHDLDTWALHIVLWETGSAIVLGAGAGYLASILLKWAAGQIDAERSSLLTIALALAVATLTGLQAVGSNGVLGAFVAGALLNNAYEEESQEHQEHFNEAITRFFDLPIMILLGAAAPWSDWIAMGWRAPAFVFGVLFLRRIPAWLALRWVMPWARRLPENLFVGWFGPVGAAAMFYALKAHDLTGLDMLWPIVSLAAFASVVAHGVTGTYFTAVLGDRLRERLATP
jgi:NhaP-type Na+/H+ or K+/H+ antiporter